MTFAWPEGATPFASAAASKGVPKANPKLMSGNRADADPEKTLPKPQYGLMIAGCN